MAVILYIYIRQDLKSETSFSRERCCLWRCLSAGVCRRVGCEQCSDVSGVTAPMIEAETTIKFYKTARRHIQRTTICIALSRFNEFRMFSLRSLKEYCDIIYVSYIFGDFFWKTPSVECRTSYCNL
jgi:hypothetical protein